MQNEDLSLQKTELYNRYIVPYHGYIYKLCRRYSNSQSDAQEFYSEMLYRLFVCVETYDQQRPIKPWLYTIIRRHIICSNSMHFERLKLEERIEDYNLSLLSTKKWTIKN